MNWRARSDQEVIDAARAIPLQVTVSGLTVVEVNARLRDDLDLEEPVIGLTVALAPPSEGEETWPLPDVLRLRQLIREEAVRLAIPYAVSVQLLTADPPSAAEQGEPASDLAARLSDEPADELR